MKINQLSLMSDNLPGLHSFYTSVLGLREIHLTPSDDQFAVQAGRTILQFRAAAADWRGSYHFSFDVPPDLFEASLLWLSHRTLKLANPVGETDFYHAGWNARSVYFRDPAGNILELIARYGRGNPPPPEKKSTHEPVEISGSTFGPHHILRVSEIGIATDDVEGGAAALLTNLPGLAVYEPGQKDTFQALGDESGLLILVRRGRIWYPETGVPAQMLPLEVKIELNQGQQYRLIAPPYPFAVRPA